MNLFFANFLAVGSFILTGSAFSQDSSDSILKLTAETVFVPVGYDNTDRVEVVLDGWMNSSCDRLMEPEVKVNWDTKEIEVTARAWRGHFRCMPVLTRFTSVATIGEFPPGQFSIVTNGGSLRQSLVISLANQPGNDEYTYAEIKNAWVDYAPDRKKIDSKYSVVLEGFFTNSCQNWDEIRVIDSGSVIEILPVLKLEGTECLPVNESFSARVFLPDFSDKKRHLLHVRSRNGRALNYVFSTY